jgi:hypothetical protein
LDKKLPTACQFEGRSVISKGKASTSKPNNVLGGIERLPGVSSNGVGQMDEYLRFNWRRVRDRQIDTLIGLSKGMLADGIIVQSEAELLETWLVQSEQVSDHPLILTLRQRVSAMLADGVLDSEEQAELFATLRGIAGDSTELGEVAKSASLPICEPAPQVAFEGRSFLFTGTCVFGVRRECEEQVKLRGGFIAPGVNKSLNYLVLGTYVTDSWIHETFGRKIEKAMEYRSKGLPLSIVTEEHWANAGGLRFAG